LAGNEQAKALEYANKMGLDAPVGLMKMVVGPWLYIYNGPNLNISDPDMVLRHL
jgi:hypothetical protein